MRGGDADNIRRLLKKGALYKRRISALCCGNLRLELLVRALKFSAHALTYLFLNRADERAVSVEPTGYAVSVAPTGYALCSCAMAQFRVVNCIFLRKNGWWGWYDAKMRGCV